MKTVPLRGKLAVGRVALVDDADYDLVMGRSWCLWEYQRPNGTTCGPYARAHIRIDGRDTTLAAFGEFARLNFPDAAA